jgi:LuxR family transcriptional regulator, maltose regulon positive regulatory protein
MQAIGGNLIRFTREEFAAFLTCTKPALDQEAGKRLHGISKGWIAGAVLWLLQTEGEASPKVFTTERVPQNIFDYFSAEILEKVSCSLYHFLLQSAHLPHMTAEMAGELTDMAAADILLTLKRKNYFIEKCRLPDPTYWYQPLFRRFLLVTAARAYPAASRREMCSRAAEILRKKGWEKAAINLYAETGAYESAASIILNVAPALIAKGRDTTLSACIELLPDEYIQKNPWLPLCQGQAQMTRNAPVSQTLCTTAFHMFNNNSDVSGQILSWATAVEIFFIVRSGFTDLDLCIRAGEHLAHLLPAGEDTAELAGRFAASMLLALLLFDLGHPDLKKWQERCEVLLERCNDLQVTADLMKNLFLSYQWLGQVHEAQRMEERLPVLGKAGNVPPRVQVTLSYTLALAAFIAGDQLRCLEKGVETLAVADKTGIHIYDVMVLAQSACALLAAGELGEAEATLKRMRECLMPFAVWDRGNYHFLQAWYAMQCGKLLTARNEAAIALMLFEGCDNPFTIALSRVLQSQLLLELGETDKVESLLTAVIKEQRLRNSKVLHFIGQLCLADCAARANQEEKSRQHLRAAFSIPRRHGLSMPFGLSSRRLGNICRKTLEAGIEVDTVKEVVKRFRLCPFDAKTVSDLWPWPVRIYTLGQFAIHGHDRPLQSSSKPQRKPLELLTFVIAGGEKSVSRDAVAARLWPDTDGDRAVQNLNTTLHRLRKLLGSDKAVVLSNGQLHLDCRFCWIDARHFAWLAQQIDIPPTSSIKKEYLARALRMYRGPYMPGYTHMPVTTSYREQLKKLWHYTLAAAVSLFVETTSAH